MNGKTISILLLAVFGVFLVAMFANNGFPSHHPVIINQTTTIVKEVDSRVIPNYDPQLQELNDRLRAVESKPEATVGVSKVKTCYGVNSTPDTYLCVPN